MYYGRHGLTKLTLPDGQTEYSRDVHSGVSAGDIIELADRGKFVVENSTFQHFNDEGPTDIPEVVHPFCLHSLKLGTGDLDELETDNLYQLGADLRDVPDVKPVFRIVIGPPPGFEPPTERARLLHQDLTELAHKRLSDERLARVLASTTFIECDYRVGGRVVRSSGTGFFINPRGLLVTNGHVVSPNIDVGGRTAVLEGVRVTVHPGTPQETTLNARVVRHSSSPDLALLDVGGWGWDYLLVGSTEEVPHLVNVIAVGYPGGRMLASPGTVPVASVRGGQVAAKRVIDGTTVFIEHSAPFEQGNSGGPLVTPQGVVIGVNTLLTGPQHQTRLAVSGDTLYAFLRQEFVERKGPFKPPSEIEQYTTALAKVALLWSELDALSFRIHDFSFTPENWHPRKKPIERDDAIRLASDCLAGIESLIGIAQHLTTSSPKPLDHRKVIDALETQRRGLETSLRILRGDPEDEYIELGRPDVFDIQDKEDRLGSQINVIQDGRSRLCYAIERLVGPLWSTREPDALPPHPFGATMHIENHTLEVERHYINQMSLVFKRHPGRRVGILRIPVGTSLRTVVFQDGLVSGSEAMRRELERLIEASGWN